MISEPLRNPLSLFDVKGKVAIVTGASGAFGRACAIALGGLGGKMLLASGTQNELDEVAAEVREVGGEVEFFSDDISLEMPAANPCPCAFSQDDVMTRC